MLRLVIALLFFTTPAIADGPLTECNRAIQRKEFDKLPALALEVVAQGPILESGQRCLKFAAALAERKVIPMTVRVCDAEYETSAKSALLNPVCNDLYRQFGTPDLR